MLTLLILEQRSKQLVTEGSGADQEVYYEANLPDLTMNS